MWVRQKIGSYGIVFNDFKSQPSQIMTREALNNAMTVAMAIGGSTNAVLHLLTLALAIFKNDDVIEIDIKGRRSFIPFVPCNRTTS